MNFGTDDHPQAVKLLQHAVKVNIQIMTVSRGRLL
jgi:hypothetical protein